MSSHCATLFLCKSAQKCNHKNNIKPLNARAFAVYLSIRLTTCSLHSLLSFVLLHIFSPPQIKSKLTKKERRKNVLMLMKFSEPTFLAHFALAASRLIVFCFWLSCSRDLQRCEQAKKACLESVREGGEQSATRKATWFFEWRAKSSAVASCRGARFMQASRTRKARSLTDYATGADSTIHHTFDESLAAQIKLNLRV